MTPDFSQIYAELGLLPGCSLEEFQHAYRKRLSERHPDRAGNVTMTPDALPLSDLIALHSSAIAFHREHGRLPGGAAPAGQPPVTRIGRNPLPSTDDNTGRSPIARRVLAIVLIVGLLSIGVLNEHSAPPPANTATLPEAQHSPDWQPRTELRSGPLELGMDTATIRAIQGEPMRINGGTWEYGPSWLRIEHGELVDWYSSPLYRLKVRTPSPGVESESSKTQQR